MHGVKKEVRIAASKSKTRNYQLQTHEAQENGTLIISQSLVCPVTLYSDPQALEHTL